MHFLKLKSLNLADDYISVFCEIILLGSIVNLIYVNGNDCQTNQCIPLNEATPQSLNAFEIFVNFTPSFYARFLGTSCDIKYMEVAVIVRFR